MATIRWTAADGNWTTASDWSAGTVPGPLDSALIGGSGVYTVSITTPISVGSITVADQIATLAVSDPGATVSVGTALTNAGTLLVDDGGSGGTTFAIGGALINSNRVQIGNGIVASTVTAKALNNSGEL